MDANTLSALLSGAGGLYQFFGGGLGSASGSATAGAAAADPFASQRGTYQGQLGGAMGTLGGMASGATAGVNPMVSGLMGASGNQTGQTLQGMFQQGPGQVPQAMLGSPAALQQQLGALAGNYMDNPAIKAQYGLGLDTVTRGMQASGYGGSGQEMKELSDYGQQFASQAYQQQFQNILAGNQQAYGQNLANTQEGAALQGQQFGQGMNLQQLLMQGLGQAGQLQLGAQGQGIGAQGQLLQSLLAASGATTGSPGTAGNILAGAFSSNNSALGNIGQGLSGLGSLLGGGGAAGGGGIGNGLSSLARQLSNLFGGGGGGLGSGALGDLFGGGGIFGGSAGTLGTTPDLLGSLLGTGDLLPGATAADFGLNTGTDLLGLFNPGTASAASAGATDVGAAAGGASAGAGVAALAAAPFAIAAGGMLGGILGYSDNGTPFTQAQDSMASAMLNNPSLAMQYGNAPGGDALSAYMAANFGGSSWTMDQYAQAQQQLAANGGAGAFLGNMFGAPEQGGGG